MSAEQNVLHSQCRECGHRFTYLDVKRDEIDLPCPNCGVDVPERRDGRILIYIDSEEKEIETPCRSCGEMIQHEIRGYHEYQITISCDGCSEKMKMLVAPDTVFLAPLWGMLSILLAVQFGFFLTLQLTGIFPGPGPGGTSLFIVVWFIRIIEFATPAAAIATGLYAWFVYRDTKGLVGSMTGILVLLVAIVVGIVIAI